MEAPSPYRVAFLDWLACAARGSEEPAALAARAAGDGLLERVTWAGTAGHVLDYDDTWSPGLVHASAAVAPVALLVGAGLDRDLGAVLDAYAHGFEATATLARAGHPALYEQGWHPTAVCGSAGAAVAAAHLHGLPAEQADVAVALALLRAGVGLQAIKPFESSPEKDWIIEIGNRNMDYDDVLGVDDVQRLSRQTPEIHPRKPAAAKAY